MCVTHAIINIWKIAHNILERRMDVVGLSFLKYSQNWRINLHHKNGCFFIPFVLFTSNHVGWLILSPPVVGWYIMGYESDPLPSYHELMNYSYYIMLNYTESPSTPQVHLPRPSPTISPSGLYPTSASPRRRVYMWVSRPHFPLCSPVAS